MRTNPFRGLYFDEEIKLARKLGYFVETTSLEDKVKLKQKAVDKVVEALGWFLEPSPYDAATSRAIAKERLKEYRKYI